LCEIWTFDSQEIIKFVTISCQVLRLKCSAPLAALRALVLREEKRRRERGMPHLYRGGDKRP